MINSKTFLMIFFDTKKVGLLNCFIFHFSGIINQFCWTSHLKCDTRRHAPAQQESAQTGGKGRDPTHAPIHQQPVQDFFQNALHSALIPQKHSKSRHPEQGKYPPIRRICILLCRHVHVFALIMRSDMYIILPRRIITIIKHDTR